MKVFLEVFRNASTQKKFPFFLYPSWGSCYAHNDEMKEENMGTAICHSLVELFDLIDYVHVKVVEVFFLNA